MTDDLKIHILERITTVDGHGMLHAGVEGAQWLVVSTPKHPHVQRTVPTVCGRKRTRVVASRLLNADGSDAGAMTMPWPPRLSVIAGDYSRCRGCSQIGRAHV